MTVHDTVGAYVVDALEARERADFEAHLSTCARCRDEVVEFRETTVELSRLVATPPPQTVRAGVLDKLSTIDPEAVPTTDVPLVAPLDEHPSIMPWDLPSRSVPDSSARKR